MQNSSWLFHLARHLLSALACGVYQGASLHFSLSTICLSALACGVFCLARCFLVRRWRRGAARELCGRGDAPPVGGGGIDMPPRLVTRGVLFYTGHIFKTVVFYDLQST